MVELSSEKIIAIVTWTAIGAGLFFFFLAWTLVQYYRAMVKKQKDLVTIMIETQEKERLRIARDMHDNFGNIFTIIQLEITTLEKIKDINRMQTSFNYLLENVNIARAELKNNVAQLAPGNLKSLNWLDELESFKDLLKNTKFKFIVEVSGKIQTFSELNQTNLYRICQELINNAIKYSEATQVEFFITFTNSHLEMHYKDNGKGFKFEEKIGKGFGLKSLKARTDSMLGQLQCTSNPDEGTLWNFSFTYKNLKEKR